jgi:methionyl-tRNA formyltransferase
MEKIKTIFIGTSEFAVPILDTLTKLDFIDLQAVVTQPDRPAGRKQELQMPAVKKYFREKSKLEGLDQARPDTINLGIHQPEKFKEFQDELLEKYQPELIIVASYGQIIPRKTLNYPKHGCLNIHGSILPKLRGAVPVQMAILQGFEKTGVTLQKMVFGMDKGPIISTREIKLDKNETSESLFRKLEKLSVDIINTDLEKWIKGDLKAISQDDPKATYCYQSDLAKENAEIKFSDSPGKVDRMVRGFYPWPVAWMTIQDGKYKDKRLKIFKLQITDYKLKPETGKPKTEKEQTSKHETRNTNYGELIITKENDRLFLNLKDGKIELLEIQLEGKNRLLAKDYLYLAE